MAPRKIAPLCAMALLAVLAAPAGAVTKIKTLVDPLGASVLNAAGVGGGSSSSFVYGESCQVIRVKPTLGNDTATPAPFVGLPCGDGDGQRMVWTTPTDTAAAKAQVGPFAPMAEASDGSLYVADEALGLVHKVTVNGSPTIVTIAGDPTRGSNGSCTLPADGSAASAAKLCNIAAVAASPDTAGEFVIWDWGNSVTGDLRIYLVTGTNRADSVIKTLAGGCDVDNANEALSLCLSQFHTSVAYYDPDNLIVASGDAIRKIEIATGAVTDVVHAPDDADVAGVATGYGGGEFYYATECAVHRVEADATDTVIAGAAACDIAARHDGVPATATAFGAIRGITGYPGGLLVIDSSQFQGYPSQLRLIDRTSILSQPPRYTTSTDASVEFATLDDSDTSCESSGALAAIQFWDPCPKPFTMSNLGDDLYTVYAADSGTWSSDPTGASAQWTVDRTVPNAATLVSPDAGAAVDSGKPTLTWNASTDGGFPGVASGIDRYDLLVDGAVDSSVAATACCSTTPSRTLSEGSHSWAIRAVDRTGNATTSDSRALSYTSPPHAALKVSPNPALAPATVTLDASGSTDREGAVAGYAFDLDGDGNYEKDNGSSPTTTASLGNTGTYKVGVRVTDGVGQTDQATAEVVVNARPIPAGLFGVTVNNGALYTRDQNVVLTVKFPPSISGILVSNDGGFLVPQAFPAQQTINWKLDSSGPERLPKIVYVRFQTGPLISETFTDDIILDQTPPVVQSASLAGPPSKSGARAAKAKKYVVKVKASDSNSGVASVQVTADKRKPGKALAYRSKVRVKLAKRPRFIRAQDRAGNSSRWKRLR